MENTIGFVSAIRLRVFGNVLSKWTNERNEQFNDMMEDLVSLYFKEYIYESVLNAASTDDFGSASCLTTGNHNSPWNVFVGKKVFPRMSFVCRLIADRGTWFSP